MPEALRQEWGDYVWWDRQANAPKALTRDEVGEKSQRRRRRCSKARSR